MWFFKHFLSRYAWYRQWRGGYWECWYIDHPVCSSMWFHNREGYVSDGRPLGGRATPLIEDYRLKESLPYS